MVINIEHMAVLPMPSVDSLCLSLSLPPTLSAELEIESRALHMLGKYSTTELHPGAFNFILILDPQVVQAGLKLPQQWGSLLSSWMTNTICKISVICLQ